MSPINPYEAREARIVPRMSRVTIFSRFTGAARPKMTTVWRFPAAPFRKMTTLSRVNALAPKNRQPSHEPAPRRADFGERVSKNGGSKPKPLILLGFWYAGPGARKSKNSGPPDPGQFKRKSLLTKDDFGAVVGGTPQPTPKMRQFHEFEPEGPGKRKSSERVTQNGLRSFEIDHPSMICRPDRRRNAKHSSKMISRAIL